MPARTTTPETATPETASAETASASNSPIVTLAWKGTAEAIPAPASNQRQGYLVKVRAQSFTLTRANGKTETKVPEAGSATVAILLNKSHVADIVARVKADAEALVKANATLDPNKAGDMAYAALWNGGSVSFNVHGRSARVKPLGFGSMLALAGTETEPEPEPEA